MPQITTNQQFVNPAFAEIFDGITARMPRITFYGIIVTYLITAGMNVYTIPLPLFVSIPTALAIQYGRFAVVFKNFLNPLGTRSRIPEWIATIATLVSIAELAYSLQHMGMKGAGFWSVFLFGTMVIAFGYILEMGFIDEGAKAFGMTHKQAVTGALAQGIVQNQISMAPSPTLPQATPNEVQSLLDEIAFYKNQNKMLDEALKMNQGNGQAPTRRNQATANMGHGTNGTNYSSNGNGHPGP